MPETSDPTTVKMIPGKDLQESCGGPAGNHACRTKSAITNAAVVML